MSPLCFNLGLEISVNWSMPFDLYFTHPAYSAPPLLCSPNSNDVSQLCAFGIAVASTRSIPSAHHVPHSCHPQLECDPLKGGPQSTQPQWLSVISPSWKILAYAVDTSRLLLLSLFFTIDQKVNNSAYLFHYESPVYFMNRLSANVSRESPQTFTFRRVISVEVLRRKTLPLRGL